MAIASTKDGLMEGGSVLNSDGNTVMLGGVIGSGSYGRVFEGRCDGQPMAVKTVVPTSDSRWEKVLREIAVLKDCTGSGYSPDLYSYTSDSSMAVIFMELMGPSLQDILKRNHSTGQFFTTSHVRNIGIQICNALSHINSKGYVHRDVKPGNICLTLQDHFKVKLVDLGEVCRIVDLNGNKRFGTLSYLPPEAINGSRMNETLDVWSLGCTLACLLLGSKKLFPGKDAKEVYWFQKRWGFQHPVGRFTLQLESTQHLIDEKCSQRARDMQPTIQAHICGGRDISTFTEEDQSVVQYIMKMLSPTPATRPTARDLCQ